MLSQDYLTKFEETLGQVKIAAGGCKFIGMLRPFRNQNKFDSFSKKLAKDQPWMAKANVSATDMLQHIQDKNPVKSIASRLVGYNDKGIKRHGETFKKSFEKANPEQFAAAQKKLQKHRMMKHVGLGAGGAAGGAALLAGNKQPDPYQY